MFVSPAGDFPNSIPQRQLNVFFGLISGYEWVGWRNDTFGGGAGKPVEMVFEFDTVRNFTSMLLHTNNMFSKDVQVSNAGLFGSKDQNWAEEDSIESGLIEIFPRFLHFPTPI